jgi:cell wall-associated NlpC family hydrolase
MLKSTLLRHALKALLTVTVISGAGLTVPAAGSAAAAIATVAYVTPAATAAGDPAPQTDTQALARQQAAARRAARAERRRLARQRHRHHMRVVRQRQRARARHRRAVHERKLRQQQRVAGSKELKAFDIARDQQGDPYVWGATGPNAFDCSGLTSYAYHRAGLSLPRTSSAQSGAVHHISHSQMRRGDLVFFSSGGHVYHVGLYVGRHDGRDYVLHAPRPGESVKTEAIWTSSWFGGTLR